MHAFRMSGIGKASIEDVPVPELAPGEVLIQPLVSGICSTDVHVLRDGAVFGERPVTLGHELVGRVVDIRASASTPIPYPGESRVVLGSLVTVEPLLFCGICVQCFRGFPNLCDRFQHLGITRDGCFAELVAVPTARAFSVDDLEPDRALFIEPLACALHFLRQGDVQAGMWVLVVGAGPAGLMTVQAAVASGARVIVSEPDPGRRALALALGAEQAIDPRSEDISSGLASKTYGALPDVIIELTGVPGVIGELLACARPGSTVVLAGICGSPSAGIETDLLVMREITIRGAVASRWQFQRAAGLIRSKRLKTSELISHRRPWRDAAAMIELASQVAGVNKVVLDYGLE